MDARLLVIKAVARPSRVIRVAYAWRVSGQSRNDDGRALRWWLEQLRHRNTRQALLENHHRS